MSYQLIFPESYVRRAKKFFQKHNDFIKSYEKVLALLEANPSHPSLRLHNLQGRLKGLSSISINLKYRITVQLLIQDQTIIFVDIGGHDEVYCH